MRVFRETPLATTAPAIEFEARENDLIPHAVQRRAQRQQIASERPSTLVFLPRVQAFRPLDSDHLCMTRRRDPSFFI